MYWKDNSLYRQLNWSHVLHILWY